MPRRRSRSRSTSPAARRRSRSRSAPRNSSSSDGRREGSGRASRWESRARSRSRSPPRRREDTSARYGPAESEGAGARRDAFDSSSGRGRGRGGRGGGRGGRRRSRSLSPPPTHDGPKTEKKAKDFSHLVQWGKPDEEEAEAADKPAEPVEKPNFGLSGALAKDRATGNTQNGVVMKWSEPPEARTPTRRYRLYVFKGDDLISTLHVHRKSAFLVGRDKSVADILTEHASCSKQHAVVQYRLFQKLSADGLSVEMDVRPYVLDLESTNGTFLNGRRLESSRYVELRVKDVLKFGESTREYVLMDATS